MRVIAKWAVVSNPYHAPEARVHILVGTTPDGRMIRTSPVVEVLSLRECRTESGSLYHLVGPPSNPKSDSNDPFEGVRACLETRK